MIRVAILIDGGYYQKRAKYLFGEKTACERAKELQCYCKLHLMQGKNSDTYLYRIFYYDCPPIDKVVFNPFTQKNVPLKKTAQYSWMTAFLSELKTMRKFAIRLGRLSDNDAQFILNPDTVKALFTGKIKFEDITENDFKLSLKQKGMDMKLGTDIASMTLKKQVDQIILIAGDSDFVPAAKLARREGIDFILDPMFAKINDDLKEHIDGIRSRCKSFLKKSDITTEGDNDEATF